MIGPEGEREEALEKQVEEEDFRLQLRLGQYAFGVFLVFLFLFGPMLSGVRALDLSFPFITWAFANATLIVVAFLVWRGWRIPLGRGRFMKRRNAWRAILAAAAFSLFLSFGRDLFDLIVAQIAPPAW
jgi:hypothetical protein